MIDQYLKKRLPRSAETDYWRRLAYASLRLIQGLIVYAGTRLAIIPESVSSVLNPALQLALIILLVRMMSLLVRLLLYRHSLRTRARVGQMRGLPIIADVILWPFAIVIFLNNQGYNVTAILTGLGIGGIAIALAAQNVLIDVFNYFVIFLDKPFEVGDFIVLDDKMGTVEYVGLKTTRVRALGGEQMILSNSDLSRSRIHNFKRMEQRRVSFWIRVPFSTSPNVLTKIPVIVRNIITKVADVSFDRAHLLSIGEYSYQFEIVYIVLSGDYNVYADVQQRINVMIVDEFTKHHVKFAVPIQHHVCNCHELKAS
ncbi:MAG: mechanosensitive ion channel family protein [Cyclobacteriaceae bacterium]|nr:mechanosensitive ion channel family protein [Cyclobacteriaceae bacterium]